MHQPVMTPQDLTKHLQGSLQSLLTGNPMLDMVILSSIVPQIVSLIGLFTDWIKRILNASIPTMFTFGWNLFLDRIWNRPKYVVLLVNNPYFLHSYLLQLFCEHGAKVNKKTERFDFRSTYRFGVLEGTQTDKVNGILITREQPKQPPPDTLPGAPVMNGGNNKQPLVSSTATLNLPSTFAYILEQTVEFEGIPILLRLGCTDVSRVKTSAGCIEVCFPIRPEVDNEFMRRFSQHYTALANPVPKPITGINEQSLQTLKVWNLKWTKNDPTKPAVFAWESEQVYRRPLSTVYLSSDVYNMVTNDLRRFEARKEFHLIRGIPYQRGYLLEGPPGVGKTSFIRGLATDGGYDIFIMNPSDVNLNDQNLKQVVSDITRHASKCMLVFEDIDQAGVLDEKEQKNTQTAALQNGALLSVMSSMLQQQQQQIKKGKKKKAGPLGGDDDFDRDDMHAAAVNNPVPMVPSLNVSTGVTFSGLINMMDGLSRDRHGTVIVLTTNYVKKLPPSLIRPGRVDCWVPIKSSSVEQIVRMSRDFFPDEEITDTLVNSFAEQAVERKMTMAGVQSYLLQNGSFAEAAERFPEYKPQWEQHFQSYETAA